MNLLKEFNITKDTHVILQHAKYSPRGFPSDGLERLGVYILYGKSDKRLWLVEILKYINPCGFNEVPEITYTMKTLKDVSGMHIEDIKIEYSKIVCNGIYPIAHYIYDTNINIAMRLPIMKQHQRQFKIKKLMAKIKES